MRKSKIANYSKRIVLLFTVSILLWNCDKEDSLINENLTSQISIIKDKFNKQFNSEAFPYLKKPLWESYQESYFNGEKYIEIPFESIGSFNLTKSKRVNTHKLVAKEVGNNFKLSIVLFSVPVDSNFLSDNITLERFITKNAFISFFDLNCNVEDLFRYVNGKRIKDDYKVRLIDKDSLKYAKMNEDDEGCTTVIYDNYQRTCWGDGVDVICSGWEYTHSFEYTYCGEGSGEGGDTYRELEPECLEPGYEKNEEGNCIPQIINQLTGKEKCIYDKLKELDLFKSTIKKFENSNDYVLTLKYGNCNNTDEGCTDGNDLSNGNISIIIETRVGNNPLNFAATLLHEGIHAELFKYVDEYNNGIDPNNRSNLLYHYFQAKANLDSRFVDSYAQHQHMADNYVKPIANAIRTLDNNRYPLEYYMGFGWDGLRKYGYDGYYDNGNWTSLDKTNSSDYYIKQNIVNNNTNLKSDDCK